MGYLFRQILLPSSKYKIKAPYSMTPQYITVHNTANDASAANEIAYHNRNNNQVSYHVAIDDKEVIQCISFNRNAWHAGDDNGTGNRKSIGIEICYSKSGGARYVAAEENAVQYIAKLLKQYGWGIDRVKQHYNWSGKNCPHRIRSEGRWNDFLNRIEKAINPVSVEAPEQEVKEMTGESEEDMLTETGRIAIRELIKKARDKGVISKTAHPDEKIARYTDKQLLSYQAAIMNNTFN